MQRTLEYTRRMPTWRVSILLVLILSFAAACTTPPEPEGPRIETAEDLLAALRHAGVEVVETAMLTARPEVAPGRVILLGAERVEVYQTDSEAGQRAALPQLLQQTPGESTLNLWGRGRVVVVYDGLDGPTIALLSGLLGDSLNLSVPAQDEPYPPAVVAAIGWLAQETGADPGAVVVDSFEAVEWPDACLGLARAGEACAAVLTPGWRVSMQLGGETYVVRSDELGAAVRREP
jgi:hypothetical protein